jgi:hypothetical protein
MRYSKGICWIGDCRIPFVDGKDIPQATTQRDSEEMNHKTKELLGYEKWGVGMGLDVKRVPYEQNQQGRFTPNLLVCDDMLNDGSVTSIKQNKDYIPPNEPDSIVGFSRGKYSGINDKGTNSRYYDLDKWFDNIIDSL